MQSDTVGRIGGHMVGVVGSLVAGMLVGMVGMVDHRAVRMVVDTVGYRGVDTLWGLMGAKMK